MREKVAKDFARGKKYYYGCPLSFSLDHHLPVILFELFYRSVNRGKLMIMLMILPIDILIVASGEAIDYCSVAIDQPCIQQ